MRQCQILISDVPAGILTETDQGKYEFEYLKEYLADSSNQPVSLTMPLREDKYTSDYLFAPFFNMLSEGDNREIQSHYWHIDSEDDFGIMLETCLYDTIGNITVLPINK